MTKWTLCLLVAMVCGVVASPAQADESLSLAKKAALFEHDMEQRFLLNGQALCKLMLPTGPRTFVAYNMPDNAYMTGIYVGALAMQYAVTKDPDVRAKARASIEALNLLATVSGKKGLLARAAWPVGKPFVDDGSWRASPDGAHTWRGDVSSDQMCGVFYGYALAYDLVADETQKKQIAAHVAAMMDRVLENDLRIVGYDGKPTAWGKYYPDYVKRREKMNALLFLQLLKVAHHVTGAARFATAYRHWAVEEGYATVAVEARRLANPTRPGAVNHSDDILLFLAYYPLLEYEDDPDLQRLYAASLRRAWEGTERHPGVRPEANPYFAFVVQRFLRDDSGAAAAIDTLHRFPLDMKWNRDTIANYEEEHGFTFVPTPFRTPPQPGEVIPVDQRAKSWSAWVMNPYAPGADRSVDSLLEFNGHDYLMAYWLGRYVGTIAPGM